MLGRKVSRAALLKEMRGKSSEEERHEREECGCFATYAERLALFAKGLLWLQRRGLSDRGEAVLNERDDELNRVWCEASLEEFTKFWRDVVREAS